MKVKIVAHFRDAEGDYSHADLTKPLYVEVRNQIAEQWIKNGWAVIVPPEKKEPEVPIERAVIETPEDHTDATKRETATVRHRTRK